MHHLGTQQDFYCRQQYILDTNTLYTMVVQVKLVEQGCLLVVYYCDHCFFCKSGSRYNSRHRTI